MTRLPRELLLIGAGKMGGALLQGLLDEGLDPGSVTVVDPRPADALAALAKRQGFALATAVPAGLAPDLVLLAIKPQMLDAVAPSLAATDLASAVLVSIMAGKTIADIAGRLASPAVVRAMPNTPAAVGRGATGVFASAAVTADQRALAQAVFASVGHVEWLDREELIDAITAVSGSGPAYVFFLVECLAEAGVAAGLPPEQAMRFARATVSGAAALMESQPATGADDLRRNVTSPGGTTAAALDVLGATDGMRPLMRRAVMAARDRAVALAG